MPDAHTLQTVEQPTGSDSLSQLPTSPTGAITANRLCKKFSAKGIDTPVLSNLDLDWSAGTFTALVGSSGCGKTTLLRILAGLDSPSSGEIKIDDQPPSAHVKNHELAIAFQDASLLPWRTVEQNIRLPLELARGRSTARQPEVTRRIESLIDLVGLTKFASSRPVALSGGMRQRTAIARALLVEPTLLLLDEPFASVDEITRRKLNFDLLNLLRARRHSTVLVTHSIFEAGLLADQIIVLSARPATVIGTFRSPLPARRDVEVTRSPEFLNLVESITDCLNSGSEWET